MCVTMMCNFIFTFFLHIETESNCVHHTFLSLIASWKPPFTCCCFLITFFINIYIFLIQSDMKPAVFWTATPSNFWRDNVACHSTNFGFWFELEGTVFLFFVSFFFFPFYLFSCCFVCANAEVSFIWLFAIIQLTCFNFSLIINSILSGFFLSLLCRSH